ncbi:MAG: aminotransferase class III-fold pyridoxal phosphate-dependent enzyme [Ferruginibacter sp.]
MAKSKEKEQLFLSLLKHPRIKAVRSRGLMMAVEFDSFEVNKKIIDALIAEGVFTDWFLFAANCLRIVPPLTITADEISICCGKILKVLSALQ